jgi:hypothetical protein
MFQRSHIEQLLRINGVESTAPDQEIKSILLSARWHEKDVETALLVLRENKASHETHVDSVHKTFRADDQLQPETISALLGIDVDIPKNAVITSRGGKRQFRLSMGQIIGISLISIIFSGFFLFGSMWYLEMGIFHITMR